MQLARTSDEGADQSKGHQAEANLCLEGRQRTAVRAALGEAIVGAINAALRLRPATTWEDVTAVLRVVDRAVWARTRRPQPARGGCRILPLGPTRTTIKEADPDADRRRVMR